MFHLPGVDGAISLLARSDDRLSGQYLRAKGTLPAIAAYPVIAPFVIGGLSRWFRQEET